MSAPCLLDASAVLAYLQAESGWEKVEHDLCQSPSCWVTAANQAEIIAKLLDHGVPDAAVSGILADLNYQVLEITPEEGEEAGRLRGGARPSGLSLGDRLCLADCSPP